MFLNYFSRVLLLFKQVLTLIIISSHFFHIRNNRDVEIQVENDLRFE